MESVGLAGRWRPGLSPEPWDLGSLLARSRSPDAAPRAGGADGGEAGPEALAGPSPPARRAHWPCWAAGPRAEPARPPGRPWATASATRSGCWSCCGRRAPATRAAPTAGPRVRARLGTPTPDPGPGGRTRPPGQTPTSPAQAPQATSIRSSVQDIPHPRGPSSPRRPGPCRAPSPDAPASRLPAPEPRRWPRGGCPIPAGGPGSPPAAPLPAPRPRSLSVPSGLRASRAAASRPDSQSSFHGLSLPRSYRATSFHLAF